MSLGLSTLATQLFQAASSNLASYLLCRSDLASPRQAPLFYMGIFRIWLIFVALLCNKLNVGFCRVSTPVGYISRAIARD